MKNVVRVFLCVFVIVMLPMIVVAQDGPVEATPGQEVNMILLPKFLGILPFDQAHQGAEEAHAELENPGELIFTGPTAENSVAGQIETVTNAVTQGVDALMISNNSGDQIAPAAAAAGDAGIEVVTWDSPIPSGEGEVLFVAQVDFDETGQVLADMTLDIIGDEGGQFAILSASPDAANQNAWIAAMLAAIESDPKYAGLELAEIVYGNDQSEESYNQALGLIDRYPDLKVIVAPTSVGAPAAAKALQDEGLCGEGTDNQVVVTGLAVPVEMLAYTENGCAPQFALWSFVDLGYLTYYVSYLLATDAIQGEVGETFVAGRMGEYEITADPTRPDVDARRVLMGPFTVYNIDNIQEAAGGSEAVVAEPGQEVNMILLPKFLGILPFDQAHEGAQEAHAELENSGELIFTGPTAENSVAGQIETVTNAVTQGVDAIMISNNSGDQIAPAAAAAGDAGIEVVTWDSPIPSGEGEVLFVAQVDFDETGQVLADMTLDIIGEGGGQFAILSASPDAANQNAWIAAMLAAIESDPKYAGLELAEIVYGNDQSEESYNQALGLIDRYPDLKVIVAPTSVGAPAAAKALQDEGLCGEGTDNSIVVTGLAVPVEMLAYTENGCAPQFALWSFVDLGYLTYYVSYLLATDAIQGEVGETFVAGRMGEYEITADPTRPDVDARRVLMGPFTVYNIDNIHAAAG